MKTLNPSLAVIAALGLALAAPAAAATFTVTNTSDFGAGSLRQAIEDANVSAGVDTIVFDAALNGLTILLDSRLLVTAGGLTITANSLPQGITLSGGGSQHVMNVSTNAALQLNRVRFARSFSNSRGGAIIVTNSTLGLTDCTFADNVSTVAGGAIYSTGASGVIATGCTFERNSAPDGGALVLEGTGTSAFSNCTFTENRGTDAAAAGAIRLAGTSVAFIHCTVFANVGGTLGGGISTTAPLVLNRSIVAGNLAPAGVSPDVFKGAGATVNPGTTANLIGSNGAGASGAVATEFPAGTLVGTPAAPLNPRLRPLGPSGGPTWTLAPLPGSPALDAGGASSPLGSDQRGFPRIVNGACDLGAVERGPLVTVTNANDAGAGSLRDAIAAVTQPDTRIQFAAALNGQTITLTGNAIFGDSKSFDLDASTLSAGLILAGGGNFKRIYTGSSGAIALNRLILRDGDVFFDAGAAALSTLDQRVLAVDCRFSGNQGSGIGGAIHVKRGAMALHRCTLSGNFGETGSGAYLEGPGRFVMSNCTVSGNQNGGIVVQSVGSELELTHCTITSNSTFSKDPGDAGLVVGGGATVRLDRCVIAGNAAPDSPDVYRASGEIRAAGPNLIGNNGTGAGSIAAEFPAGPLVGTPALPLDPLLGPLGDYGVFLSLPTHALRPGSPARDAAAGSTLLTDQRGVPRVGAADLGAYEAGFANPNFAAYIWETLPTSATVAQHAPDVDFDGDGASNYLEWLTLTNAANPASVFRPIERVADGFLLLGFATVAGRSYTFESSPDLLTWTPQGTIIGDGQPTELAVIATGFPKRFARIRVSP